jgi:phage terminase large subunit-like protein
VWSGRQVEDELRPGDRIALGFDGSIRDDATALIACRLHDGLIHPLGIWESNGLPEWEVDVLAVDAAVVAAFKTFDVQWMYADPAYWQDIVGRWALEFGDTVVFEFWTGREANMARAIERFHTAVVTDALIHTGHPRLARHIANTHKREVRSGYVLSKEHAKSKRKIDAAIAAILAYEARADAIADGRLTKKKRRVVGF